MLQVQGFRSRASVSALALIIGVAAVAASAQAQSTPRQVVMGCFAAMRRFDVLDRAGELKLPMLILHGFYDVQFPLRQALHMAVRVPGSLVKVLNTGHEAPAEDPQAVTRAVDCFLRATRSASNCPPEI